MSWKKKASNCRYKLRKEINAWEILTLGHRLRAVFLGQPWHELSSTATGTDHDNILVLEIHIISPSCRMEYRALELVVSRDAFWPNLWLHKPTNAGNKYFTADLFFGHVDRLSAVLFDLIRSVVLTQIANTSHQMLQSHFPDLFILEPDTISHVCVELYFVDDLVLVADALQVCDDLSPFRVQRCPSGVWAEGVRVEDGWSAKMIIVRTVLRKSFATGVDFLHITRHARITVDPPRSTNSRLTVEDPKLVTTQDFFQSASHGNATLPGSDDGYRIVCETVRVIAIIFADRVAINLLRTPTSAQPLYNEIDGKFTIRGPAFGIVSMLVCNVHASSRRMILHSFIDVLTLRNCQEREEESRGLTYLVVLNTEIHVKLISL